MITFSEMLTVFIWTWKKNFIHFCKIYFDVRSHGYSVRDSSPDIPLWNKSPDSCHIHSSTYCIIGHWEGWGLSLSTASQHKDLWGLGWQRNKNRLPWALSSSFWNNPLLGTSCISTSHGFNAYTCKLRFYLWVRSANFRLRCSLKVFCVVSSYH